MIVAGELNNSLGLDQRQIPRRLTEYGIDNSYRFHGFGVGYNNDQTLEFSDHQRQDHDSHYVH